MDTGRLEIKREPPVSLRLLFLSLGPTPAMRPSEGYTTRKEGPKIGRSHWKLGSERALRGDMRGTQGSISHRDSGLIDFGQEETYASQEVSRPSRCLYSTRRNLTGKEDDPHQHGIESGVYPEYALTLESRPGLMQ